MSLITVLILQNHVSGLSPLLDEGKSLSFLPVSITGNLLSMSYSWINSYFSKDKIYVVCTPEEESDVKSFCKGIYDENIIIEPKRINYYISVFYATLVIGKFSPDEVIFFVPVNFLFQQDAKIGNWLFAVSDMASNDWIVVPSIQLNRDDKETEFLDAGKIVSHVKGFDFFSIDSFNKFKDESKKKKMFGKYGKYLNIICGKQKQILKSFVDSDMKNLFIKILSDDFKSDGLDWGKITKEYDNAENETKSYEYFSKTTNILTIFLDTKPYYLDNWSSILERFSSVKGENIISGNVAETDCRSVICLNYDNEEVLLESLQSVVLIKKNGKVAMKSIK
jgi:mannose-1-phosphate guanylyltransferase